jgi:autotransporter adhesin
MGLFSGASGTSSIAVGREAKATKKRTVAIGAGSVANVADTVSVGSNKLKRRIVNLAPGSGPSDAVTVAQLQGALSAARASAPVAPNDNAELTALRALVARLEARLDQQQQRIAQLEGRTVASAPAVPH